MNGFGPFSAANGAGGLPQHRNTADLTQTGSRINSERNGPVPMPVAGPQRPFGAIAGEMQGFGHTGMPRSPPKNKSECKPSSYQRESLTVSRHSTCALQILLTGYLSSRSDMSFLTRCRVDHSACTVQILCQRRLQVWTKVCVASHHTRWHGDQSRTCIPTSTTIRKRTTTSRRICAAVGARLTIYASPRPRAKT